VTEPTASESILVDSSGWLEYITADSKAPQLMRYFDTGSRRLIVPTIVIYEVRKILLLRQSKIVADYFVSEALLHQVIPIDAQISLNAASLSVQHQLHMADALIYATACALQAELITTDTHFNSLPGVTVL